MTASGQHDRQQRRRLRLGALLFQLRYYMQAPADIAANLYRYSADTYVQVDGNAVRFVDGDAVETLDLDAAIDRCKAALQGAPLHQPPS
jgi:hypothetical protein